MIEKNEKCRDGGGLFQGREREQLLRRVPKQQVQPQKSMATGKQGGSEKG